MKAIFSRAMPNRKLTSSSGDEVRAVRKQLLGAPFLQPHPKAFSTPQP